MTLGKKHVFGMLPLLAAAVTYNVWYFTKGEAVAASRPIEPPPTSMASVPTSGALAPPVDPARIPPVIDVGLDTIPEWRRNPFIDPRQPAPATVEERVQVTAPEPEPALVVSAIFTSSDGRLAHAKVNGRTVRVGDRVGSATVIEIQPKTILIESPAFGRRTIGPERRPLSPPRGGQ